MNKNAIWQAEVILYNDIGNKVMYEFNYWIYTNINYLVFLTK